MIQKIAGSLVLILAILVLGSVNSLADARLTASTISTDLDDYAPYDSVVITGSGFWPLETIIVQVTHHDGLPEGGEGHDPWEVFADSIGSFETFWIVPPDDHVDETLLVVATGVESGETASVLFTDANTILTMTLDLPDTLCGGFPLDVCANLSQACGQNVTAPLPGRELLFFLTEGNCGVDVGQAADDTVLTDVDGNACATLTIPPGPGTYAIRVKFLGEDKPSQSEPPNSACDPTRRTKLSASNLCRVYEVIPDYGNSPVIDLGFDTTVNLCETQEICLPVTITDPECDIDFVTTNIGSYSGTIYSYDQIGKINTLGGSVTQVGGGAPGSVLYSAADFVPPVNTQSGVSVTLPDFIFGYQIDDYGPFPSGIGPVQSADQLVGSPTDLTFTTPGAGGPDGGSGDGSVDFSVGNHVVIGLDQEVTTCNGASVDFVVFTNTNGGGTAELKFLRDGLVVYSINQV